MSVISVTEITESATAGETTEIGTCSRSFHVDTNGNDEFAVEILQARDSNGIPAIDDVHPYDQWMNVTNKNVTVISRMCFLVTVFYESAKDPLNEDPVFNMTFNASNEPIDRDFDGNPILNSSDEPIETTEDIDDLVLHYEFNLESIEPAFVAMYKGAINDDPFAGFERGHCRVTQFDVEEKYAGDYKYVHIVLEIQIRQWDTWTRRFVDKGFRTKSTDDDGEVTYTNITDSNGDPIREAVLLDGEGQQLAADKDPVVLEYETKKYLPFAALGV